MAVACTAVAVGSLDAEAGDLHAIFASGLLAGALVGKRWECYEVPHVVVLEGCGVTLYSTRVMRSAFGFDHRIDQGHIRVPGAPNITVHDTGSAYVTPCAFVPSGAPRPAHVRSPQHDVPYPGKDDSSPRERRDSAAATPAVGCPASGMSAVGKPQATLFHQLGFPYAEQWKQVPAATVDHGLPPNAQASPHLTMPEAVARGRARALPFMRRAVEDVTQPPPAAVFYMDFAGPLLPSIIHRFTCYVCCVDAGSGYGRLYPAHHMTAVVATGALETFTAEVAALMGFHGGFKPQVVRSDQGSAFVSHHFREFLAARQIHQSLACTYTPQQNAHAERFFGVVFSTARVLLAAASLPPTFHPFALQTAAWLHNRLPRPSRGNVSPYFTLSRALPSLLNLHSFGCLCSVVVPTPRREGDRHFADRGEHGLYLGPSERSPGHVVYLLSSRRVATVAKLLPWEDQFPGLKGEPGYTWFPDSMLPLDDASPAVPSLDERGGAATSGTGLEHARGTVEEASTAADGAGSPHQQTSPGATPTPYTPRMHASSPPILPTPRAPPAAGIPVPDFSGEATVDAQADPVATRKSAAAGSGGAPSHRALRRMGIDSNNLGSFWQSSDAGTADSQGRVLRERRGAPSASAAVECQHPVDRVSSPLAPPHPRVPHAYSCIHHSAAIPAMAAFAMLASAAAFAMPAAPDQCPEVEPALAYLNLTSACDADLLAAARDLAMAAAPTVTITAELGDVRIPKSYRQAMNSQHCSQWKEAIAKELGGLLALRTWDMVPASSMPPGSNLMHCHYVFTVKRKADGSIEKFKARLVADGNTQKHGVDFDRIFASVVRTSTIRLVLALAAARDYNLTSFDIRQAYLQAELTRDLYMRPPPDVYPYDSKKRPLVCKLRRSLYGLKQAGREWAVLLTAFLLDWGFARSPMDPCLYLFTAGTAVLWVCIYVDDGLLCDNDAALRDRFVAALSARFPTEDKGELQWMLNVALTRDRPARSLVLSQALYVSDLVAKYGHWIDSSLTRRFDSPMDEGVRLSPDDQPAIGSPEYDQMATRRPVYMSLVGGYLWLANMTLWHLAYAAGQLSRFLSNPGPAHFRAALRLLAYLRDNGARPLRFAPNASRGIDTYVDSDWGVRFSVSGALVFVHGCLIHWFSKMQRSVSLSSAEAEYFGAMMAARDILWLRDLLVDLGAKCDGPCVLWSDSKSAVDMSLDPIAFKNTKHILRAAYFLRDLVSRMSVAMRHVPGRVMIADLLTKSVGRQLHLELLRLFDAYATDGVVCPA